MSEPIIVIDFETTGLSPNQGARATEVAAVVIDNGRTTARFHSLMNAGVTIPSYIEALTGITNAMIQDAPPAEQVIRDLAIFVGGYPLVAHNASFDRKFLDSELNRVHADLNLEMMCSMRVARRIYPNAPNHRLSTLIEYVRVPSVGRFHRALADAEMTAQLWLAMQNYLRNEFKLPSVPLELMRSLQTVPRHSLENHIAKHKDEICM